jgi:hypothetical protein
MLRVLLAKDLRRAWRNPLPWLIFIAVPLVIVALIGTAFGPRASGEGGLGRIRFALVDEDDSPLTSLLRGAANQSEGGKYLEPVLLERAEAERQVRDNQLSAMLVIPRGFTRDYLTTTNVVALELVKNPAQSIHPAVMEELLAVVVTGLDALKQHLGAELPEWQAVFDGSRDYRYLADLIVRAGEKVEAAYHYLSPLRVGYVKEDRPTGGKPAEAGDGAAPARPAFNLFGYLLPGMAAMFLLFLGNNAITDLKREFQQGTLARTRTLHHRLLAFVGSKVLFAMVMLWICGAIMLGGGGVVFRIPWRDPVAVVVLTACYAVFAAGLMCLLGSVLVGEERADAFSNVTAMAIGLAGGGAFPAQQLPAFLRDYITPWLPNHWYTQALQEIAFGNAGIAWSGTALLSLALGLAAALAAAWLLQRRIELGRGA